MESPFFETPNLSFEGRVRNVARGAARRACGGLWWCAEPLCPTTCAELRGTIPATATVIRL